MTPKNPPGPPMTLANMREHGYILIGYCSPLATHKKEPRPHAKAQFNSTG
jgi:hypothetical protein